MASNFLDTTITTGNYIQFNKLKVPSTSGGSTFSLGTAGQCLASNASTCYWATPQSLLGTVTDSIATYYTWPSSSSASTYTGSMSTIASSSWSGSKLYMFGTTYSSSTISGFCLINGSTNYASYSVPAGATLSVTFNLTSSQYMRVGSTNVYSASIAYGNSTFYAAIRSYYSTTSTSANLSSAYTMSVPIYTTSQSATTSSVTVSYTNTGTAAKTVYAQVYWLQSNVPFTSIKTSSSTTVTSGTVYLYPKASITSASITSDGTYPQGKSYHLVGSNGAVHIDSDGDMILDLPSAFFVKKGNYGLLINSDGIQKTTDSGQTFTDL